MTAPIQPTTTSGHICKKPSCWLYGFATIGILSTIVGLLCMILLMMVWSNIKPFLSEGNSASSTYSFDLQAVTTPPIGEDGKILLSEEHMRLLQLVGIDPAKVQGQDPKVLKACAVAELGAERVAALESGQAEPTMSDFMAIKTCVE